MIFRAVSKILSFWVNTASSIAGESKLGSTFVSTFPRKCSHGNPLWGGGGGGGGGGGESPLPPPPPAPLTCNDLPIFNNTWKVHWGFLLASSC